MPETLRGTPAPTPPPTEGGSRPPSRREARRLAAEAALGAQQAPAATPSTPETGGITGTAASLDELPDALAPQDTGKAPFSASEASITPRVRGRRQRKGAVP